MSIGGITDDGGGSSSGGGNGASEWVSFLEFRILGFWLHIVGCVWGLNVKNPAEKMCVFGVFDLRWKDDDDEVEVVDAMEQ